MKGNLDLLEFLITLSLCCSQMCKADDHPTHIIFILVDDLGWNDISFHGSHQIPTPNIDTLAGDGIILNNYYVQPICTPSRGALMTGKYPIHIGLQHDVIYSSAPWGLPKDEKIMPQYLKDLGYITRGVGKWHLGFSSNHYLPTNRGFDSFFGYWAGKGDFFTHYEHTGSGFCGLDFHDDNETVHGYFGYYSTELFTAKAKDIIKNHNVSKPLYLHIAHQAPHTGNSYTPFQSPIEYVQRFPHIKDDDRRKFAGVISALDFSIGEIFAALEESGMLDNSIIVFSSDNGAAVEGIDDGTGSNWPLRGSKYTLWEGGMRTVGFVWSPSLRHQSRVSHDMMHVSDWLPTLYAAVGGKGNLHGIDGFNLWPTLCCNSPSSRKEILHNIDPIWNMESIRRLNYKLVKGRFPNGDYDGWFDKEGKKTNSSSKPFTSEEKRIYYQVYGELMKESQVRKILLKKYSADSSNVTMASEYRSHPTEDIGCTRKDPVCKNFDTVNQCNTFQEEKLEIKCGERPKYVIENCKPDVAACLFDIEKDPCEYHNLAVSLPNVVKELEELLDSYRKGASDPVFKPNDEAANPKYHDYVWTSWQ